LSSLTSHFEIYADDPAKLAEFYRVLFGWHFDRTPGIDYWRIRAGSSPTGAFAGGLTYRPIPAPHGWVQYVAVPSLDEALAKTLQLGGEVLYPKTAVPKTGWYAIAADPEGNTFAIWQADPTASPPPGRSNSSNLLTNRKP